MKKLLLIISLALIFISCSGKLQKSDVDTSDFKFRKEELKSLLISSDLTISAPGIDQSGSAKIYIAETDSIRMDINGPFGIPIGKLYSNKDYFIFYNIFESIIYKGSPKALNFQKVVNIPLSFNELIHLLRNETPYTKDKYNLESILEATGKQVFTNDQGHFKDYVVFNTSGDFIQYQQKDSYGEIVIDIFYENHSSENNYPKIIKMNFPFSKTKLMMKIKDIEIESIPPLMQFNYPDNIETNLIDYID